MPGEHFPKKLQASSEVHGWRRERLETVFLALCGVIRLKQILCRNKSGWGSRGAAGWSVWRGSLAQCRVSRLDTTAAWLEPLCWGALQGHSRLQGAKASCLLACLLVSPEAGERPQKQASASPPLPPKPIHPASQKPPPAHRSCPSLGGPLTVPRSPRGFSPPRSSPMSWRASALHGQVWGARGGRAGGQVSQRAACQRTIPAKSAARSQRPLPPWEAVCCDGEKKREGMVRRRQRAASTCKGLRLD